MPVNINTVGGSGIADSSGNVSNTNALVISRESNVSVSTGYPSYYIHRDEFPSGWSAASVKTGTGRLLGMFTYRNKSYIVTSEKQTGIYTLSEIDENITMTNVLTFDGGPMTQISSGNSMGCSLWSNEISNLMIPTPIGIIYVDRLTKQIENPSSSSSLTTVYVYRLCIFDGYTITVLKELTSSNSTLYPIVDRINFSYNFQFIPLNHQCTELLLCTYYGSSTKYWYKIKLNPLDVIDYSSRIPISISHSTCGSGSPTTTTTSFIGFSLVDGHGMFSSYYRIPGSYNVVYATYLHEFDVIDDEDSGSFTISNINPIGQITTVSAARIALRVSESNVTLCPNYYYPGSYVYIRAPYTLLYDFTDETPKVLSSGTNSSNNDSSVGGTSSYINAMYLDRVHNMLFTYESSTYSDNKYRIARVSVPITYISNNSDIPESIFHASFMKGDILYCSTPITHYALHDEDEYHITNGDSRVFIIPADGIYNVKSVHNIKEYVPSWIAQDRNGNILYLKITKIDDTTISGDFISGMTVNGDTIVSDGIQRLTVSDISNNGIYVNMKGVK